MAEKETVEMTDEETDKIVKMFKDKHSSTLRTLRASTDGR